MVTVVEIWLKSLIDNFLLGWLHSAIVHVNNGGGGNVLHLPTPYPIGMYVVVKV